jgi:phosphodiesterase/alkaline phosphatase D-like protein
MRQEAAMVERAGLRARRLGAAAGLAVLLAASASSFAETGFSGVAAGDMTERDVILWTRAFDTATGRPADAAVTAQLAAEPGFRAVLLAYQGRTDPARDGTLKIDATGLASRTRYFYRFVAADGAVSPTGQFVTAPQPDERAPVRFAFSGDAHGAWRPYPLMQGFGARKFDYFIFLGDTIYETASKVSPHTADPFRDPARALVDYRRKYLENITPVRPGGAPSLAPMFAAQGNYTLLDNHELGNKQFVSGGAPPGDPPGAGVDPADPANDANASCAFINQTRGFAVLLQAYRDYQPVRERRLAAPGDCRSNGTWQLYFAQRWGKNLIFINVDDRSYRDIQLMQPGGKAGDTGPRADNPARTMLGKTQLGWLEQTLLDAQRQGVTWKMVAISSPIDQAGPFAGSDGPKSWIGGYRAERNRLLKFIADNRIEHVVFLTTDDHRNRIQPLYYEPGNGVARARVADALTIVAGPIGAGGPDRFTEHGFAVAKLAAEQLAANERAAGLEPIGLPADFPGLIEVYREGDPDADRERRPVDFFSPDTFNYAALEVSADGKTLAVDTWGIDSYAANLFLEPGETAAPRRILGFRIKAD